jgi:hypothetical protein
LLLIANPLDEKEVKRMESLKAKQKRLGDAGKWREFPEAERKELLRLSKRANAARFGNEKREEG